MRKQIENKYVADFETTDYKGMDHTEVWAAALVRIGSEDVDIFNNIDDFMKKLYSKHSDISVYFHNLKFDGEFILNYLLRNGYKESLKGEDENRRWDNKKKDMQDNEYTCLISANALWYDIMIKHNGNFITFKDSLKLIPLSVNEMGKAFNTKHRKTSIEYNLKREAGGPISDKEKEYIANDVLVVKEALEYMFKRGDNKLTIGSCCMSDFKEGYDKNEYKKDFPNLSKMKLDKETYGSENAEEYIRNAYKGGWCYVNKYKQGEVVYNGCTADVNSLYPSVMQSESGSAYPVGKPKFWKGNIPWILGIRDDLYYFVRLKTRFKLKDGYLPFIQIKDSIRYSPREMLETSDVKLASGYRVSELVNSVTGETIECIPTLTLTCTDYELFKEHYDLYDTEILDGCYFETKTGLFDNYINYWANVKMNSTGGMRQVAKLRLNNLYGKFAGRTRSDFKIPYLKDNESLGFETVIANDREAGYIPIGAAITSYARNFTIRAAQSNYHKMDPGFVYADTDSIHCDIDKKELVNVPVDPVKFNHWKIESEWEKGFFTRPKTYLESVNGTWNIKCAGMPKQCKDLVNEALTGDFPEYDDCTENEKEFLYDENKQKKPLMNIEDFTYGLTVPGKLHPKHIPGGVVLEEVNYTMKEGLIVW